MCAPEGATSSPRIKNASGSADSATECVRGVALSESRASKRHRWRFPCEIIFAGGRQRSFVLDLSETGLFVQTSARLRPGSEVEVRLTLDGAAGPLTLLAHVARSKQVPSHLTSVAHGGVGLQLQRAPKEYLDALAALHGVAFADPKAATSPAIAAAPATKRFRVRVKQCEGPRSRSLSIAADSAERARALALRETGDGWEVSGVESVEP